MSHDQRPERMIPGWFGPVVGCLSFVWAFPLMFYAYVYQPFLNRWYPKNYVWMRLTALVRLKGLAVESFYQATRSRQLISLRELTAELAFWLWPITNDGVPLPLESDGQFIVQDEAAGTELKFALGDISLPLGGEMAKDQPRYETQLLFALSAPLASYLQLHEQLPATYAKLLAEIGLAPIEGRLALMQDYLGTVEIRTYRNSRRVDVVCIGHPEYGQLSRPALPFGMGWMVAGASRDFELSDFDLLDSPPSEPEIWWRLAPDACGPEVAMPIDE